MKQLKERLQASEGYTPEYVQIYHKDLLLSDEALVPESELEVKVNLSGGKEFPKTLG